MFHRSSSGRSPPKPGLNNPQPWTAFSSRADLPGSPRNGKRCAPIFGLASSGTGPSSATIRPSRSDLEAEPIPERRDTYREMLTIAHWPPCGGPP